MTAAAPPGRAALPVITEVLPDARDGEEWLTAGGTLDNLTSMARKSKTLSNQIRDAMKASNLTRYRLSKLTGIDQTALMRFERGEVGLLLDNIDKLASALGLGVVKLHSGAESQAKRGRKSG